MSDDADKVDLVPLDVDIRAWVESARNDPNLYRARQVTEIQHGQAGDAPGDNGKPRAAPLHEPAVRIMSTTSSVLISRPLDCRDLGALWIGISVHRNDRPAAREIRAGSMKQSFMIVGFWQH